MKNNSVINGGTFQGKPKRREIPKRKFRCPRMTVCIAMIAKNTQSGLPTIVFTADKLVSTNTVCFEGGNPKIAHLYPHTYVMTSSDDALSSDEIVIKTQQKLSKLFNSDENLTVEQIVNILSQECKSKYELEIEERRKQIFSRYNFTSEEFKFKSKDLSEKIVLDVIESLHEIEYDFKTNYFKANFLIVGIDTEPHIYVVNELGKIEIFDHIGFATIGSGQFLAFPEITRSAYLSNISDVTAVMTVYKAKKAADLSSNQ
jgi:20S proteasome alpha/beta subunit